MMLMMLMILMMMCHSWALMPSESGTKSPLYVTINHQQSSLFSLQAGTEVSVLYACARDPPRQRHPHTRDRLLPCKCHITITITIYLSIFPYDRCLLNVITLNSRPQHIQENAVQQGGKGCPLPRLTQICPARLQSATAPIIIILTRRGHTECDDTRQTRRGKRPGYSTLSEIPGPSSSG